MNRRTIIKQFAEKFKDAGITAMPSVEEFNALGLMNHKTFRRLFTTYKRGISIVFREMGLPRAIHDDGELDTSPPSPKPFVRRPPNNMSGISSKDPTVSTPDYKPRNTIIQKLRQKAEDDE